LPEAAERVKLLPQTRQNQQTAVEDASSVPAPEPVRERSEAPSHLGRHDSSTDSSVVAADIAVMTDDDAGPSPTAGMQPTRSALRRGAPSDRDRRRVAFEDDDNVVPIVSYREAHLWWSPSELGEVQTSASKDTTWSSRPRGRPPKKPGPASPADARSSTPPNRRPSSTADPRRVARHGDETDDLVIAITIAIILSVSISALAFSALVNSGIARDSPPLVAPLAA